MNKRVLFFAACITALSLISCDLFFSDISGYVRSALEEDSGGKNQPPVTTPPTTRQRINTPTGVLELDYTLLPDNTYAVSSYNTNYSGIVEIPSEYEGIPVTRIATNGFQDNNTITDIFLPASITVIESHAFSGCTNLTNITIGPGVVQIEDKAFSQCVSLSSVILPAGVVTLGEDIFAGASGVSVYTEKTSTATSNWDASWDESVLNVYDAFSWFKISLETTGGLPMHAIPFIPNGSNILTSLPTPTKDGSTFLAWYEDQYYNKLFEANKTTVFADATFYAKWNE